MTRSPITTLDGLADQGLIARGDVSALAPVADRYAVAITPDMAALIDAGDPADPIGLQFLPRLEELVVDPVERADPIGDAAHMPVPGLVHRYEDRVLLKVVHVCPVYCRFCFRREMVGPDGDGTLHGADLDAVIDYVAARPQIWEVILTGGDPLMLSPRRLGDLVRRLSRIDHVGVIRLHSRVPVVAPDRVTGAMVEALQSGDKAIVLAIHANHPRELTPGACRALRLLADGGVMLVSQTVLLKGINDDAETLATLMRRFVEARVKPYYLHHPDLAPGTAHFRLSIAEGRAIVAAFEAKVSGLCRPTYVLDVPGGHGKVRLMGSPVTDNGKGGHDITDRTGAVHSYPPASGGDH